MVTTISSICTNIYHRTTLCTDNQLYLPEILENIKVRLKCVFMEYQDGVYTHGTLEEGYDFFINDRYKKSYHFRIDSFPVPSGLVSEAWEVVDKGTDREPYRFNVLSDFDADMEEAELILKAQIQKGINKRYLTKRDGRLCIKDMAGFMGRIDWDENIPGSQFDTMFVVDGKRIRIEDFVRMIEEYQGYNIKISFHDMADDRRVNDKFFNK